MSSPVRFQRPSNLSLDAPKPKSVTFKDETLTSQTHSTSNTTSPRKFRCDSEFRTKRKRAHSCSFSWDHINSKRRKSSGTIVLPSKFLLGGNITDPLNLEALDKEDSDKTSEEALGGGYRRGGTVRVIIPPNINDPLNLDACSEDGDEQLADAISRQRRRRKTRKRKRRNSEPGAVLCESIGSNRLCTSLDDSHTPRDRIPIQPSVVSQLSTRKDSATMTETTTTTALVTATITGSTTTLTTPILLRGISDPGIVIHQEEASSPVSSTPRHPPAKKTRTKSENKIVSPVIPQPGVERKRHCSYQRHPSVDKPPNLSLSHSHLLPPKHIHPKNASFQYGNYNQYYGYRNMGHKADPRLKFLKKEWFTGKEVLDIGCNIGHITLCVGRDFVPQRIIGIDIDRKLINIARKNIKHYLRGVSSEDEDEFPSSMKLLYGPLRPPVDKEGHRKFPHNVKFWQSNYVMESDALLETVRPEFDVVLCLSVTKWIHLNWGDEGLKRFFRRIYRNLKQGGLLILEPQAWPSYGKKRKLTNEIFENYKNIRLFPNKFGEFLTSDVGFTYMQKASVSQHYSKGFDRPIYIYKKPFAGKSPSQDIYKTAKDMIKLSDKTAKDMVKLSDADDTAATDSNTGLLSALSTSPSLTSQNNKDGDQAKTTPVNLPVASEASSLKASPAIVASPSSVGDATSVVAKSLLVRTHKDSSENSSAFPVTDQTESPSANLRTVLTSGASASHPVGSNLKRQVAEGTAPDACAVSSKIVSATSPKTSLNIPPVNAHVGKLERDQSERQSEQSTPPSCDTNAVGSGSER